MTLETLEGFNWEGLAVLFLIFLFFTGVLLLVKKEMDRYGAHYHKNHPDKDQH